MSNEEIAELCYEVNRAYCKALGDETQLPWADGPDWQRESVLAGVFVASDGVSPAMLHKSWMARKVADGWQYGAKEDLNAKTHPRLMPYDQLPREQQVKDHLFTAIVGTVKRMAELKE